MPRSSEDTDILESSSNTGSRDNGVEDQLIAMDIENHGKEGGVRRSRRVIRLWKIPLPLRKDHLVSDLVKNLACLITLLFGRDIDRNSLSIWDDDRQNFIHDVLPVPVHSHNDYWRRIPLFEALASGCISVEADVHLRNSDLLVGHTARNLHNGSTLRSMYLEPLQRMLEAQNANVTDGAWRGLFNLAPQQTLVLLVDHKTSGPETFTELHTQLQPLRDLDYLTYWNGTERVVRPLTIVASGNAPFQSVTALDRIHRDIFWDAKLEKLVSAGDNFDAEPVMFVYNRSNSYFASTEFKNAVLYPYLNQSYPYYNLSSPLPDTPRMKDMAASQIEQANARGLMARYYNTPAQPPNLREIVWRVLVEHQVDILNMDDMGTVRARAHGWGRIKL